MDIYTGCLSSISGQYNSAYGVCTAIQSWPAFICRGGTFDVSLLKFELLDGRTLITVVGTAGDPHLGGQDWDRALMNHVVPNIYLVAR
jgi:hypothetical protein